jgi:hypothetical protein
VHTHLHVGRANGKVRRVGKCLFVFVLGWELIYIGRDVGRADYRRAQPAWPNLYLEICSDHVLWLTGKIYSTISFHLRLRGHRTRGHLGLGPTAAGIH